MCSRGGPWGSRRDNSRGFAIWKFENLAMKKRDFRIVGIENLMIENFNFLKQATHTMGGQQPRPATNLCIRKLLSGY